MIWICDNVCTVCKIRQSFNHSTRWKVETSLKVLIAAIRHSTDCFWQLKIATNLQLFSVCSYFCAFVMSVRLLIYCQKIKTSVCVIFSVFVTVRIRLMKLFYCPNITLTIEPTLALTLAHTLALLTFTTYHNIIHRGRKILGICISDQAMTGQWTNYFESCCTYCTKSIVYAPHASSK